MKSSKLLLPAFAFGLGPLLSYVALPFITASVSATDYGNYTYYLSVLSIISFLSLLPALNSTVNRYGNRDNITYYSDVAVLKRLYLISTFIYVILAFIFLFYSDLKDDSEFLLISIAFFCVNLFNAIKSYFLINNNKTKYSFFVICICVFQYSYVFLCLSIGELVVEDILFGNVVLMLFFLALKCRPLFKLLFMKAKETKGSNKIFNFVIISFVVSFSTILYNNTDKMMMDFFLEDPRYIALYQVSFQIFAFPIESLYALFSIFMPAFLYRAFDRNKSLYIINLKITFKLVLFVLFIVTQSLLLFKSELKSLLLDPDYIVNDYLPIIFLTSQSIFLLYLITTNIFIVNNKRSFVIFSLLFSSTLNFFLNWYLINNFGYTGAALSTLVSYFVLLILMLFFSFTVFRINYFDSGDLTLIFSSLVVGYVFYNHKELWLLSIFFISFLYFRKYIKNSYLNFLKGV